jgi:hypothetical protein
LYWYNSRWYDPYLARFNQPDTIIPNQYDPNSWDRYLYVSANPLRYRDPSGHRQLDCTKYDLSGCDDKTILSSYKIHLETSEGSETSGWNHKTWGSYNMLAIVLAVLFTGDALAREIGGGISSVDAFRSVYADGITLTWGTDGTDGATGQCTTDWGGGGCTSSSSQINFYGSSLASPNNSNRPWDIAITLARNNVVHEFGHAFGSLLNAIHPNWKPYSNIDRSWTGSEKGYHPSPDSARATWRQARSADDYNTGNQVFADMFLGWVFNAWADDKWGSWRGDEMFDFMSLWMPRPTN